MKTYTVHYRGTHIVQARSKFDVILMWIDWYGIELDETDIYEIRL